MDYVQDMVLTQKILSNSNIGLWAVEIEEGSKPRMYADRTMLKLLGIDRELSPEEVFESWRSKVDSESSEMVDDAIQKMIDGVHAEVQYPWYHPTKGLTYVRCGGIRNYEYSKYIRLEGCHQDITALVHIQKMVSLSPEILGNANIGLWDIEIDDGKPPRMHADETMKRLLGIKEKLTPEETYQAWYKNVHPAQYQAVNEAVERMTNGLQAEVQYPWIHPEKGLTYVRCGGSRNFSYTNGIRLEGSHQDVSGIIHIQMQMTEMQLKLAEAESRTKSALDLAVLDSMTHVYNHEGFKDKANEMIEANRKKGILTFLMFIDMDHLKGINDSFGHDEGDFCLKSLSDILAKAVGERGIVGRLGGDEFAIAASYREPNDEGKHFYESINYLIELFNRESNKPYKLGASLGGIMICPNDTCTLDEALSIADDRMYDEKKKHHSF